MHKTINPDDIDVAAQARRVELARRDLINYDPFFRYMAARHEVETSWDCPSKTACTNSEWVKFNPAFVSLLTPGQIKTVYAHELLHIYWCHPTRMRRFIPELAVVARFTAALKAKKFRWNKAGDFRINDVLKDCGFEPVPGWLWDPQYADPKLSTEAVYRKLEEAEEEESQEPGEGDCDGDGDGDGGGTKTPSPSGEPTKGSEKDEGEGNGDADDTDGNGEGEGKGKGKPTEDKGNGEGGGTPQPNTYDTSKLGEEMGEVIPSPLKTEQEMEAKEAEQRTVLKQAASLARAQGKLPGSLAALVEEITVPKVPWFERLRHLLTATVQGDDYTFRRPNKRYAWADMALPVNEQEGAVTIAVIRDTSGSCLGDIPSFNAHITDILGDLRPQRVLLLDCDAEVHANHDIEWTDGCDWPKEITGCGGTSFCPPFDWIAERGIVPDVLIYLTDSCGTFPKVPTEYPTIWVCVGDWHKSAPYIPPFGEVIPIE